MIPRPRVATVPAVEPLAELVRRMGRGHSRYPVVGESVDDVIGVVYLRDVLPLPAAACRSGAAGWRNAKISTSLSVPLTGSSLITVNTLVTAR